MKLRLFLFLLGIAEIAFGVLEFVSRNHTSPSWGIVFLCAGVVFIATSLLVK